MLSAIGSIVLTIVYLFAPISNDWILPVGFLLGYVSLMMFSPMGSFMTELYPTAVRGVGQGFCYNAGRGIGALFPAAVGFLSGQSRPGRGDRHLQRRRLWADDRRAAAVAGNPRPVAGQPGEPCAGMTQVTLLAPGFTVEWHNVPPSSCHSRSPPFSHSRGRWLGNALRHRPATV